jgi:hypothetical protein
MTNKITLPPLPHRALRLGAGDDAMTDYARAAVLLDRQQRAAPSAEPVVSTCDDYPECERERDALRITANALMAERDALLELVGDLDAHEGAEGWSDRMRERINAALAKEPK